MPTDKVLNRDFSGLFKHPVRFEIPFFQRGYAWEQRQWKKLLEDINHEVLENVTNNKFEEEEHFFGPIVVLEKLSSHTSLKKFLVIDGQQRITTVYLLLALVKRLIEAQIHQSVDAQKYVAQLSEYIDNNVTDEDEYLRLKVFSTKGDRFPTYKAVFGTNPDSSLLIADQLLYSPDSNKVDEFMRWAGRQLKNYDVNDLWRLSQALLYSLKIVWIPLDEKKDDEQAIFESLNDAGMPLASSELLCNYIFRPLSKNQNTQNFEKLHNDKWLKARKQVGENNFEEYLRVLFSIGESKKVGKDRRMYVHFKTKYKKLSSDTAISVLDKILEYTSAYRRLLNPIEYSKDKPGIQKLLLNVNATNMTSTYPYLIALLKANETDSISDNDTELLLKELLVLVVRRKFAKLPVTKYDTLFPSLLDRIINEPDKVRAFHDCLKKEGFWVADQIFQEAFERNELYNKAELDFGNYMLQELDKAMSEQGELADYSTLNTIEHIMPQTVSDEWKNYLGDEAKDHNLPVIINTIGNLCLNSREGNSKHGQKLFEMKKGEYTNRSPMIEQLKTWNTEWNTIAIQNRSRLLAEVGLNVWKWRK